MQVSRLKLGSRRVKTRSRSTCSRMGLILDLTNSALTNRVNLNTISRYVKSYSQIQGITFISSVDILWITTLQSVYFVLILCNYKIAKVLKNLRYEHTFSRRTHCFTQVMISSLRQNMKARLSEIVKNYRR